MSGSGDMNNANSIGTLFGYLNEGGRRLEEMVATKNAEIAALKAELITQAGANQAYAETQEEMISARCRDIARLVRYVNELRDGMNLQVKYTI